ncbi:hypothetical protein PVAND_005754 [Polypedilum vanderplanki]|uniref:receptor protein-tyrosine kinase n=1 Tax=Polypedilum vanderplanki TaxID=319348 RepID=A0A9J6C303_POLVA|nr:hypothetical protein PVAND_005754 [Polypedilum vanderplanki]
MFKQLPVLLFIVQLWMEMHLSVTALIAPNPLRGYHGAPIIDPFDSVIIDVNGKKLIECKGKRPVTWLSEIINKYPDNAKVSHFLYDSKDDDSILFTDEQNLYRTNLELSEVTVDFVGEYYCVFNDTINDDPNDFDYEEKIINYEASSIYVFVNDPENLLYEHHQNIIWGRQYEPFVIPCKPTSPQVRVELKNEDGQHHYVGTYDPKRGFIVSFHDVESSGFYECLIADDPSIFTQFQVIINEQFLTSTTTISTTTKSSLELQMGDGKNYDVNPRALSAYIKKPIITSETDFYARDGDQLQITCHVELENDVAYSVFFTLPNGKVVNETSDFVELSQLKHEHDNRKKSHITLTIDHAEATRDKGDYTCTVKDLYENSNSVAATIVFVNEPIMEWKPANQNITTNQGKKRVQFLIEYVAYPEATFEVYNNHNELIARGTDVINREKYDVVISKIEIKFVVKSPNIKDFGEYTILATTDGKNYTQKLYLTVAEKPTCTMEDVYIEVGQEVNMRCECQAYPLAEMSWSFQECSNLSTWPECGRQRNDEGEENKAESEAKSDFAQVLSIRFTPNRPGTVTCRARNKIDTARATAYAKIGDLPEPFMITGLRDDHQIAHGDLVELECGAIIYNYSDSIQWTKDGNVLENGDGIEISDSHTEYSWRKRLILNAIKHEHDGEYNCEVKEKNSEEIKSLPVSIRVNDAIAPQITPNFNDSTITKPLGEMLRLECFITGLPTPKLSWKKDGEIFQIDKNDSRVTMTNNDMTLAFSVLKPEDSGVYECIAENRIATERKQVDVVITTPSTPVNKAIIIGVITIILVLVLLSLYLCLKVRIKKRQIAMLKAAGLANFEEGQVESIDPDVNIDEQADLLPYDKKFEFPREKLKLGKQLGAGAFGVVVKATAQGILHYEEETTVAVKMVKKQTDNEVMKALVSELKIMIHMGQHLNVVNLLGAVTKNIAKRELMVIVEYCRFGNLQSFLVKHRPYFIDQVRNDRIDPMIMKNEMRWSKNSAYNSFNSEGNQYTPQLNLGVSNPAAHMNTQGYVRHSGFHQVDSCNTEATVVSNMETVTGEDNALLSNNSDQPLWRSNYGADYKGPARTVCTSDLVCWAFQVARGMDYLATRKVLHGDLAARNILLCDDNIVKICDFGLARSMYKNDNYKKKGEAPLPFKWLSIEAISDHVFSTYSDVWAYGVVLWELFTLGKVPYTGMEANQELFYKLRDGYRMEKPKYATQDLYDIMLNCWNAKPESRPLFNELERKLSSFMMDSVKDHYLDLNEPYMQANTKSYESGVPDYLTQMSIPEGEAPKPPLAQEEMFSIDNSTTNVPSTPDYLSMSPKSGVVKYNLRPDSPTIAKNLDTSPKNKKNVNKKPELPEEIPMLAYNQNGLPIHDSDEEQVNTYTDMKIRRNSSGRKKRQAPQPPVAASTNQNSDPEYKNIFAPSDNYVNVPAVNKNASVANPAYITFQSVNERA